MSLRFLADENVPGALVQVLRAEGHEVAWIAEIAPGLPDAHVLSRAIEESRVLLSFDKDFVELARVVRPRPGFGIILLRFRKPATGEASRGLARVLRGREDWAGHFSVVEPSRIRMRPLAPSSR